MISEHKCFMILAYKEKRNKHWDIKKIKAYIKLSGNIKIKKKTRSTIITVLLWSKIFSVMLYSNCKLHDFKKKARGCENAREESESACEREREKSEREWQQEQARTEHSAIIKY